MKVGKTLNELLKEVFGNIFCKLATLSNIGKEVTARTKFHHKAYVLAGFEGVVQADDTLLIRLLQDGEFLHHLLFLRVLAIRRGCCIVLGASEDVLVVALNCH